MATANTELTPMKRQYYEIKERNQDCILFFRLGDFYEMFDEDAKVAARELDLTLTTRDRNKPKEEQTPMCGVPFHSVDSYIARLVQKGYKVAICEQMQDPATTKGLVERDITRIVTPGTVTESCMLDESRNNYMGCIYGENGRFGLAFCGVSTGAFFVTVCSDAASAAENNDMIISQFHRILLCYGFLKRHLGQLLYLLRPRFCFCYLVEKAKFQYLFCLAQV